MKNKFYTENIEKNDIYREEYISGIKSFLENGREIRKKERQNYISPEALEQNREKYREDFICLLGYPLTEKRKSAELISERFVASDGNVDIYRLRFSVFGGVVFYGILFKQKQSNRRTPFVYCLHGGGGTPEVIGSIHLDSDVYHHLARRFTEKGASVFCPQFLLWEKKEYGTEYDRIDVDSKLRQLGGSVTAMETLFLSQTLDYFINKGYINENRAGVAGLSYGGMYALSFSAYDTRVKACLSSSWFNDRFRYSWSDWSYLGAQSKFTDAEIAALICPRRLMIAIGDKDCMFDSYAAEKEAAETRKYYRYCGKETEFGFYIYEADHEFDISDRGIDFILDNLSCGKTY